MVNPKTRKTPAQKTIIVIIILAILAVITSISCIFIFSTEVQTKNKISSLASEYYENYFYPKISKDNKNLAESLENYAKTGFARVTLRQLILSSQKLTIKEKEYLYKICNENSTFVQFFPESPYNKTSYHTEYSYSCKF